MTTTEAYDGRGRVIFTYAPNDNGTCTQRTVEHRYLTPSSGDATGSYGYSYELVSNPYCTPADVLTMGWTRTYFGARYFDAGISSSISMTMATGFVALK
jgi:hypothetical protein